MDKRIVLSQNIKLFDENIKKQFYPLDLKNSKFMTERLKMQMIQHQQKVLCLNI